MAVRQKLWPVAQSEAGLFSRETISSNSQLFESDFALSPLCASNADRAWKESSTHVVAA